MIEVELRFSFSDLIYSKIKEAGKYIKSTTNQDTYYDFPDHRLLKRDNWLRLRNSQWELKKIIGKLKSKDEPDTFLEIEDEDKIKKEIGVEDPSTLEVYASLLVRREKYKYDEFNIDVDFVESTIDDFKCSMIEIELMVSHDSERDKASQKILDFAKSLGTSETCDSKLTQYLLQKKADLFAELQPFWLEIK